MRLIRRLPVRPEPFSWVMYYCRGRGSGVGSPAHGGDRAPVPLGHWYGEAFAICGVDGAGLSCGVVDRGGDGLGESGEAFRGGG